MNNDFEIVELGNEKENTIKEEINEIEFLNQEKAKLFLKIKIKKHHKV